MRGFIHAGFTVYYFAAWLICELLTLVYWGATWGLVGAFVGFVFIPSPLVTPFVVKAHYGRYPPLYLFVLITGIAAFFVAAYSEKQNVQNPAIHAANPTHHEP